MELHWLRYIKELRRGAHTIGSRDAASCVDCLALQMRHAINAVGFKSNADLYLSRTHACTIDIGPAM